MNSPESSTETKRTSPTDPQIPEKTLKTLHSFKQVISKPRLMGGASSKDRATTPESCIEAYDIVSRIVPKEAQSLLNRKVSLREELRQVETRLDEIAARHGANRDHKNTARSSKSSMYKHAVKEKERKAAASKSSGSSSEARGSSSKASVSKERK